MTITEFLLDRIAEDEAAAYAPPIDDYEHEYGQRFISWESDHSEADTRFVSRFDPARVLAECAAKRAILGFQDGWLGEGIPPYLAVLAAVYGDHPDYDEAWRM